MVQPHLLSALRPRPMRRSTPAFNAALALPTKPLQDGTSPIKAQADFRTDLLAATPNLRAFAMSLVGNRERADDLVQDTLVRALEHQDRFVPGTKLGAWLITILRNRYYSDYRSRWREVEDVDGLYAATLSHAPEQPWCVEFAELRSALAKLPDEQREAILLVGAEGLTYEEAAEVCGTKVGTIKSRVSRARTCLAELLGHEHDSGVGRDRVTQAALGPSMSGVPT